MARGAGVALKSLQIFLRTIEFCCAAVILGLFSYFLAKLSTNHLAIDANLKSVEGISGVAVCYTILSILLVCFVGGLGFFALVAFLLDLAFVGCFIYVAWETRHGAGNCTGNVITPFGSGDAYTGTTQGSLPTLRTACKIQTANFAVAIVAIFFFLVSAFVEIAMWRHHKSEKKYGPSPANNYTTGSGRRKFWQRKNRNADEVAPGAFVAEKHPDTLPTHTTPADTRTSYATENTMVGAEPVLNNGKYGVHNHQNDAGYVAPHGTAVNY